MHGASATKPSARRSRRRTGASQAAFTLLEVVLVVSIIGFLSAIAVPRLTRSGANAEYVAQHRDWQVVQKQIEIYAIEHFGIYPAGATDGVNAPGSAAAFGRQMHAHTDVNGIAAANRGGPYIYGDYIRDSLPAIHYGPHKGKKNVRVVTGATKPSFVAGQSAGWIYNATTGDIVPNVPDRSANETGVTPIVDFGVAAAGAGVDLVEDLGEVEEVLP